MSNEKHLLGKVFISHSSVDKPFVRKLAEAIERAGFRTWLDEKELVPGDPLAKKISEALDTSRVVLVVVSSASVASRWLSFELNKATDRMVKGECRVMPIIIEKVAFPPEVAGLLYSDFTEDFDLPLKGVLTALEHEARSRAWSHSFWSRAELLIKSTFDATGWVSVGGEYKDKDYNVAYLYAETGTDADRRVAYETVSGYSSPARPIRDLWWSEYSDSISNVDESLFLVLTERPVEFATESTSGTDGRITFKTLGWKEHVYGYVVFVDLSSAIEEGSQLQLLADARDLLRKLNERLESKGAA